MEPQTPVPNPTNNLTPRLLTVPQAAVYLGASIWAVRNILNRGEFKHVRVGKRFNIAREELDAWVDAHKRDARRRA